MDESIHVRLIANYHVIRMESLPEFTGDDKCSSVASASRYSLTNRMEYKRTTKAGTKIKQSKQDKINYGDCKTNSAENS